MRLAGHRTFLVALLLLLGPGSLAAQPSVVTWMDIEFAPFYIHEGPDKGQGIADRLTQLLVEKLPDYEHRFATSSPDRIVKSLGAGEPVCSAAFLETPEREKVMLFSAPALLLPPNGITVRRDSMPFEGKSELSIDDLLSDPSLRGGIARGRAYGAEIDGPLMTYRGDALTVREGEDIYSGLLSMLIRGRVDWIVGYPYEAVYVARQLGVEDQVRNLRLVESPAYVDAFVVCPRNPWGEAIMARIDAVLQSEVGTEGHRDFVERWLDPDSRPSYREAYAEAFEK